MALNRFGQYVKLTVVDRSEKPVFETDSLRVDFDIRNTSGWVRAKISIYNLAPDTIKTLAGGENYVTITTSLHNGLETVVVDKLYVSNSLDYKDVPNSITQLFCYSKIRKASLEKQIEGIYITQPSLRNMVKGVLKAVDFPGEVKFKNFPEGYLDNLPPQPQSYHNGSALACLKVICGYHRCYTFTEGDDLIVMYKVHSKNRSTTDLDSGQDEIKLSTDNMRANPKIGTATLDIISNLDPLIKPSVILDVSELLTATTNISDEDLAVAEDILSSVVAGHSKYQTFTVQHLGSNYTDQWQTRVNAIAPTDGYNMPIVNWFR